MDAVSPPHLAWTRTAPPEELGRHHEQYLAQVRRVEKFLAELRAEHREFVLAYMQRLLDCVGDGPIQVDGFLHKVQADRNGIYRMRIPDGPGPALAPRPGGGAES
jgi:hypothetical protein